MPLTDAVDVAETWNGISFPILSIRDLIPWSKELQEEKKNIQGGLIPSDLSAVDRWKIIRNLASAPDIIELRQAVETPEGVNKVLYLSLKKFGKNEEEINKILDIIPTGVCAELALFVSGFYKRALPEQPSIVNDPSTQTLASGENAPNPLAQTPQTLNSV